MNNARNRTAARQTFALTPRGSTRGFYRVAVILMLLTVAALLFKPAQVEASPREGSLSPSYLRQLEDYRQQTAEYFRVEEERKEQTRRLEESVLLHTIKKGETLSQIALLYGVQMEALAYWNNLANPNLIRAGNTLHILTVEGTLHHVQEGDTLTAVANRYNVERQFIAGYNMLEGSGSLTAGDKLVIPGVTTLRADTTVEGAKDTSVLALASRGGSGGQFPPFHWPLMGTITSFFGLRDGQFHYGLDIAAPYGSEVRAIAAGAVQYTGIQRGYGLMLVIDHGNGWSSLYAHNSRLLVTEGERVLAGQPITRVGSSGNATGPHLHLEIMQYDKKLDPLLYLP
ncbi:MAG: M23 family metallopeptidase [Bacillota bacterium]